MYRLIIDGTDDVIYYSRYSTTFEILKGIGEEPNDCVLVCEKTKAVFRNEGTIDHEKHTVFKTVHPDYA